MKVNCKFAWYDIWIGAFWDRNKRILHICPLPMLLISITFEIYFWYGDDLLTFSELSKETYKDTGHTPWYEYADKHWKADIKQVIKYFVELKIYKIKEWLKRKLYSKHRSRC